MENAHPTRPLVHRSRAKLLWENPSCLIARSTAGINSFLRFLLNRQKRKLILRLFQQKTKSVSQVQISNREVEYWLFLLLPSPSSKDRCRRMGFFFEDHPWNRDEEDKLVATRKEKSSLNLMVLLLSLTHSVSSKPRRSFTNLPALRSLFRPANQTKAMSLLFNRHRLASRFPEKMKSTRLRPNLPPLYQNKWYVPFILLPNPIEYKTKRVGNHLSMWIEIHAILYAEKSHLSRLNSLYQTFMDSSRLDLGLNTAIDHENVFYVLAIVLMYIKVVGLDYPFSCLLKYLSKIAKFNFCYCLAHSLDVHRCDCYESDDDLICFLRFLYKHVIGLQPMLTNFNYLRFYGLNNQEIGSQPSNSFIDSLTNIPLPIFNISLCFPFNYFYGGLIPLYGFVCCLRGGLV